ncbi:two-partner secretion domain-containing protein [Pseudomonas sp. S2_C03]
MDVRPFTFLACQPSSQVNSRERFWGMPKRGLAFLLANVMFWQPMWAQAEGIVVATPGTTLDHAGNGVPIVNIATPNGSGLSHNQFVDYNVGAQGVILNNGSTQTSATQLGGIIIGNPHLKNSGSAQTILNEVVGGSPSQLRGYTEVAGQSARVIVANPYGITCNGCGFINTPRATLTTGKPVLDGSGRLERFQVDQGSVAIEGAGLNATNVDHFEIITRSAKINAEIQANNLTIVAGRNDVNAQTLNATARADDGSLKPQLAIDSSALGGMYAGAIRLVGTEAGVGVKVAGSLAASGGDIQIDANGHLSLAQTSAAGAVNVKAVSLDAQSAVYAGTRVDMQTETDLNIAHSIAARDSVTLNAGRTLTNNGVIEAGVNADNSRNAKGDVSLTAQSINNTGKSVVASRDLTVTAQQALSNQGGTLSGQRQVTVNAATLDNQNRGRVLSADRLSLTADKVLNNQGGLIKGQGQVEATLGHLSNTAGEVSSQGNATLILGSLDNSSGTLMAQMGLDLSASAAINNQGGLVSGWQELTITGTYLDNSNGGTLSSRSGDVGIQLSDALVNKAAGAVVSQKALTITASSVDNSAKGNISSTTDQTITVSGLFDNSAEGLLSSGAAMTLNTMALNNVDGTVNASGDLAFNGTELNNSQGTFTGQQAITLDLLGALINTQGRLSSAGPLLIERSKRVDNQGGELSSQRWLSLFTGELDNSAKGTLAASDKLLITASGHVDNTNAGLIASRNGELELGAGSLANAKGQVQAKQALHVEVAADVGNQDGQIVAKEGKLSVKAANLDNQRGRVAALNDGVRVETAVNGTFDNRNGSAYAKTLLEVDAGDLDNSDGQISASQIGLNLQGALNNRNGLIESLSTLATTAASLDNQNGQLRAMGVTDKTRFSIGGTFDNSAGRLETANTDLSIEATGFKNQGGSLLHAGSGVFGLSMANLNDVGGRLVTQGDLTLDTDTWTNSTSIQAERLTVNVKHLTQTSTGQLLAATHLEGAGTDWRNDGLIGSDGTLNLVLTGNYAGKGRLSSLGNLDLHASSMDLQATGSIAGGSETIIDVDDLLANAGRITSSNNLTLKAGDINNSGTLGSGKDLLVNTTTLLNDHGLISSGGNAQLLATRFTNRYAQVYSLGSMLIAKDAAQVQADLLDNRSGGIESLGPMTIAASTVNNVMDVLEYTPNEKTATRIIRLPCEQIPGAGCDARSGGRINGLWEIYETDRLKVTKSSASSSLSSGADLLINTQTLTNTSSTVASAGNLQINAGTIKNQGLQNQQIHTVRRYWSFVNETGNAAALADVFNARNNPNPSASFASDLSAFLGWMGVLLAQNSTVTNGDQSFAAVIQAGGNATLNAGQTLDNGVVRSFYAYVGAGQTQADTSAGNGYSTPVFINAQLPPEVAQQQVNPVALPGFTLPTHQNGLFRLNSQGSTATTAPSPLAIAGLPDKSAQSKPHKYLIETNPALTDLKQFMSSDYLLSNLGYDPDTSAKRLGDGFYEQRMIQQAVTARTGQRFIDGQDSDEKLFKYLMDNAVQSKQQLNLSVGVSLTAEQVAALTHDIVWLESHEVNGEEVLVPVLYMAHTDNRLAPTGALIAGNDVSLIAGKTLNNVGTLRASNNLSSVAAEDIVNSGLVEADKRLDLLAGNNLVNRAGGIIAGRDVGLTAITGDVINERTVTTHQSSGGGYTRQERRDFADSAARIEAGNDLSVKAGQDINIIGGALQSGQDMSLSAERDINVSSVQVSNSVAQGGNYTSNDTTQLGSSLGAGRDLTAEAGRDIAVIASDVDAERDLSLDADENLTISSAANEQHSLFKSKELKIQEDHVSQVMSNVTARGDVKLSAGQNMAVISSRINAGDEAYLVAGDRLDILAAQDTDYSLLDKKKKGGFGAKETRRDEVTDVKNIGTQITASGNLMLVSAGDQRYQVARLESGKNLTINSGGAITFEGVKDLHQESHEKSSSSLAWTSAKGRGNTDETLRQSQLVAHGQLVIKAVDGLNIDIKQIDQKTVSQTIDAMVQADPQLAWLKEAEKRGDVDWRLIKETHESFKYSHSSLGQGAMLAIIIIVTVLTGGAASGVAGAVSGSTTAAASAAGISAGTASALGTAAGYAAAAGFQAAVTQAAISTVNNKGNLLEATKDITSGEGLKGILQATVTGGLAGNNIPLRMIVNAGLKGGSFKDNLVDGGVELAANILAASIYSAVGDQLIFEGLPAKMAVHALVGGLIAEAIGGDFRTAALAAGANEAFVSTVGEKVFPGVVHEQVLAMTSQLLGMTVAAALGGSDKDQQIAGWVAGQATANNYLGHVEVQKLEGELIGCRYNSDPTACRANVRAKFQALSDSKTGTGLYDCKKNGESACADQLADAQSGSAALDWLLGTRNISREEREIIEHFQDINHEDDQCSLRALEASVLAGVGHSWRYIEWYNRGTWWSKECEWCCSRNKSR